MEMRVISHMNIILFNSKLHLRFLLTLLCQKTFKASFMLMSYQFSRY